nr:hypothetical protein [Acidovorax sp.]
MPRGAGQGAPARWWAHLALVWLVLALVAAPSLGRLHQVVHGDALDRVQAHTYTHSHTTDTAGAEHSHGLLAQLVAGHAPTDCLLLDQLALGDALHSAPLALPEAAPAQAQPHPLAGRATLPHTALFLARGPPAA